MIEEIVDVSISVPAPPQQGSKYIFSVGNLIPSTRRQELPLGGQILEDVPTLRWQNQYLRQCEITELRQQSDSEKPENFMPSERKHMPAEYNETTIDAITGAVTTTKRGAGFLHVFFYPANDVARIVGKQNGVVEMPVANASEKRRAQLFLFPHWSQITARIPEAQFPTEITKIRSYLNKRRTEAETLGDSLLIAVANAAIESCDAYTNFYATFIDEQNTEWEKAKTLGYSWPFSERVRMLSAQLGIQLRDDVVRAATDKMDSLTENMAKQAENQNRLIENQNKLIEMQIAQANGGGPLVPAPAQSVVEVSPQAEVAPEPQTCGATTVKGTPCPMPVPCRWHPK